jgi:hypothetical protein
MAKLRPERDVVVVHRRAPAEDVVVREERRHHVEHDADEADLEEVELKSPEPLCRDAFLLRKTRLEHIEEGTAPVVERHLHLDGEIGDEDDEGGAPDRPVGPGVIARDELPGKAEDQDENGEVDVEPEIVGRKEEGKAERGLLARRKRRQAERGAHLRPDRVPDGDADSGPEKGGGEEQLGPREEGMEQGAKLSFSDGSSAAGSRRT